MKKSLTAVLLVSFAAAMILVSYPKKNFWNSLKDQNTAQRLKQFVILKEAQANAATNAMPAEIQALFKYAESGDWLTFSNSYWKLGERTGNYVRNDNFVLSRPEPSHGRVWTAFADFISDLTEKIGWYPNFEAKDRLRGSLRGTLWESIKEVWGAFDCFIAGDEKYSTKFGRGIIDSIPAGSIYFGGTDPGRFIVTAMCQSQPAGDPFFTLTQNAAALADKTYLDYLRNMYGRKIYIPTEADKQKCLDDYLAEVEARIKSDAVKSFEYDPMGLSSPLTKIIFDNNSNREFYIEESYPLDWMYPYLEPHGLIMKINRQPLVALSDEIVKQDNDYWSKYVQPMIGDWLKADTSVEQVAAFAEKVFAKKDFTGFTGDPRFIENAYSHRSFSKLRSSQAGLYAWRVNHATAAAEKKRMAQEADFAFRQAWALCPDSYEAVFRYVNFLLAQNRIADALVVAETASQMPSLQGPEGGQIRNLVEHLQEFQKAKPASSGGK